MTPPDMAWWHDAREAVDLAHDVLGLEVLAEILRCETGACLVGQEAVSDGRAWELAGDLARG